MPVCADIKYEAVEVLRLLTIHVTVVGYPYLCILEIYRKIFYFYFYLTRTRGGLVLING